MCSQLTADEVSVLISFKQWIVAQQHLNHPKLDDKFLLRFLRNRKFNLQNACEMFEKYLKVRHLYPHCYQNLDINDCNVVDLFRRGYLFPLLERDPKGRTVIFVRSAIFNQKYGHKPTDLFRAITMTFEVLLDDELCQTNGFVYVFDQQNVCLSQVSYLGIREIQLLLQSGEKCLPVRHKEVHWLHLPFVISTIFYLIAGFVSEKLRKRLHFHSDLKSLHKTVPANILPEEYGDCHIYVQLLFTVYFLKGGKVSWKCMAHKWLKQLQENREKLISLDSMSLNNSRNEALK
ncbi:clavesin-1-like protein [Leptotrombidium deliense]|uniref:Clavesin-1-like protein n=1 Tax=Leptotrombidium deliense TaxID=299467 RepID=A0A443S856_9ACAR|nr:clavesin-1-like protein [Leptotrombidium deliense]